MQRRIGSNGGLRGLQPAPPPPSPPPARDLLLDPPLNKCILWCMPGLKRVMHVYQIIFFVSSMKFAIACMQIICANEGVRVTVTDSCHATKCARGARVWTGYACSNGQTWTQRRASWGRLRRRPLKVVST